MSTPARSPSLLQRQPLRGLLAILIVAAAYYASGRLGLLLAIPPGYATAVWPASGVALAAVLIGGRRVWPGVLLGSLMVNWPTAAQVESGLSWMALLVPLAVAGGATLQALIGSRLVAPRLGQRSLLEVELDAVPIMLLGGPLSCLVSSTVGVLSLWLSGQLSGQNLLANWVTWWVGDSMGVLVFAPLVLLWAQRGGGGTRERLWISVPLLGSFALMVSVFLIVSQRENARLKAEFDRWCEAYVVELRSQLEEQVTLLHAMRGLFEGPVPVSRAQFDALASAMIGSYPTLRAVTWSQRIEPAALDAFEAAGRADYGAAFAVGRRSPDPGFNEGLGEVRVRFVAPLLGNAPVLGSDLAADPQTLRALRRAAESGAAAASGTTLLPQDPDRSPAIRLMLPVRPAGDATAPVVGFVGAALLAREFFAPSARILEAQNIELHLTDIVDEGVRTLYRSGSHGAGGGLVRAENFAYGGRSWQAQMSLPAAQLLEHRSWETWVLLAAGMLFTSLLGLFLLVVFGRGRKIEQQVVARTAELHRSNEELSHELAQGERLRRETLARAEELAAINQEVEQFGYIVSHDLSAPLRSVGNFAQLLDRRAAGVLDENGREFLGLIREGVNEMQRLIDALVRMSRVSGTRLKLELLDSRRLVQRVLQALHVEIETQHADIKLEELPRVYADEDLLRQLFQQLIGNALLYRRPESPPQVRISAHAADGEWHFAVADSGTGLSAQNVPRLFQVFRRFHPASQYPGTGVGLAICRKIVRLHGGRIWAESTEGQGSTFHFTLPQEPVRGRGEATAH